MIHKPEDELRSRMRESSTNGSFLSTFGLILVPSSMPLWTNQTSWIIQAWAQGWPMADELSSHNTRVFYSLKYGSQMLSFGEKFRAGVHCALALARCAHTSACSSICRPHITKKCPKSQRKKTQECARKQKSAWLTVTPNASQLLTTAPAFPVTLRVSATMLSPTHQHFFLCSYVWKLWGVGSLESKKVWLKTENVCAHRVIQITLRLHRRPNLFTVVYHKVLIMHQVVPTVNNPIAF
jgi:hypothetical protein